MRGGGEGSGNVEDTEATDFGRVITAMEGGGGWRRGLRLLKVLSRLVLVGLMETELPVS